MITMEQFYLALEHNLKATPSATVVLTDRHCLRIIMDGMDYCPITFMAQVHQLGNYGNQTSSAYEAGRRLQMRQDNTTRVIHAADGGHAPVVRNKLLTIMRPYLKEQA